MTATNPTRIVDRKDLVLFHENWQNPRTDSGLDDESIKDLGKDIKARDFQRALIVQKVKTDIGFMTLVLDGQRRVLAAESANISDIPVQDYDIEIVDLTPDLASKIMLDMLSVAGRTAGLSSVEQVNVARRLREQKRTVREIGDAIGRDASWVTRMLEADKSAAPEVVKEWRAGELTDEAFKDLAKAKIDDQPIILKQYKKIRDEDHDPGTARQLVKEIAEDAKAEKQAKIEEKAEKEGKKAPKKSGPKGKAAAKKAAEDDKKPDPPSRKQIEEMAMIADGKTVANPYVRGMIDTAKWVLGQKSERSFDKAWKAFLQKLSGTTAAKKAVAAEAKKKKAA